MCGRYLFEPKTGKLAEYYQKLVAEGAQNIATGEVFPSERVLTIGANQRGLALGLTEWGFRGFKKGQRIINARIETVEEKPLFRQAFQTQRCVFPMTGFYEWNQAKEKFLFRGEEELYVGGFYRLNQRETDLIPESIILTTQPDAIVAPIHQRMPLLINKKDLKRWLMDLAFARDYPTASAISLTVGDGDQATK